MAQRTGQGTKDVTDQSPWKRLGPHHVHTYSKESMNVTERSKSHTSAPGTPTVEALVVNNQREENILGVSRSRNDDDQKSDGTVLKTRNHILKFGTWNVRTLSQEGKYENLVKEAKALNVDILGISETRLTGTGENSDDELYTLYNSGGEQHEHGVGILIKKKIAKAILGVVCVSRRNILVKIKGAPLNLSILQTMLQHLNIQTKNLNNTMKRLQKLSRW